MRLLDTRGANPKLKKTSKAQSVRYAGLSLYPDPVLCPGAKAAGCMAECLRVQGRGKFDSVTDARQARADFFYSNPVGFLQQLDRELQNFSALVSRNHNWGAVRLNVLSDICWEDYGVPQKYPELLFVDYTKQARRLGRTPDNYRLIFSYSGREQYWNQNRVALQWGGPVAVVFRGGLPGQYLGRPVWDGDRDDITNAFQTGCIIGLTAKGTAARDRSGFVIDNPDALAVG